MSADITGEQVIGNSAIKITFWQIPLLILLLRHPVHGRAMRMASA